MKSILTRLLPVVLGAGAFVPATIHADDEVGGQPVIAADALLKTPVGGLERTHGSAKVVPVSGQSFSEALQVTTRDSTAESNATQLTMRNAIPIKRGDSMLATLSVRGAQTMLLFEKATDPWTKSITQGIAAPTDRQTWKRVLVPFTAAEDYAPGDAMVSLRFAFGPQKVEVGGLTVVDFGKTKSKEALEALVAENSPLGSATVMFKLGETRQTMVGLGGNFCQPRYGSAEPMDAVGRYNLAHLRVAHARIGIPLDSWTPEPGVYRDEGAPHAALLQMQEMARRKIPMVGSIWEGPIWMLGGRPEQSGRTLPPERYGECIDAIAQFLMTARDRYGATVDNISFNEADYGVNFRFTPAQIIAFIRKAGPRFRALGLKTKFLVGDTANANSFVDYARPLLSDPEIRPYLGPLAFHCWDVLTTPDARYAEIAALGRETGKQICCTEAGHDSGLWQTPNPWASWDNALRTALAYEKTVRLTGASVMDYWTYQNNYPIVRPDGSGPYPVFSVIRELEQILSRGSKVIVATADKEDLHLLATSGPRAGQFAALLVNPIGPGRVTLEGLPAGARAAVVTSTAAAQGSTRSETVDGSGHLTVTLPARGIVIVQTVQ